MSPACSRRSECPASAMILYRFRTHRRDFNGLTWPHVSVATFVPASPRAGTGIRLGLS